MNVLAIYPGMTPRSDNSRMLIELQEKNVKMSIIASKSMLLKGKGELPAYSDMEGIQIHRLFRNNYDVFILPRRKLRQSLTIAQQLEPDLIFSSGELNIRLALLLQKSLRVPIVLLVEEAGILASGEMHSSFKMKTVMRLLGLPTGPYFWDWLCKHASSIITCHPRDIPNIDKLKRFGKPIYYVPWPTYIPHEVNSNIERKKYRGVYIGSLEPFKNTQEFEYILPKILRETPTKEFIVVGSGAHSKIIKNLQKQTNGALKYIPELSRKEALELIASSYYAYTPVIRGGWGFMADCWSMGTPLVMTHKEDNYALPDTNALSANDEKGLIQSINQLYNDSRLYDRLQENGYKTVEEKQTNRVRDDLHNVFSKTLELNS